MIPTLKKPNEILFMLLLMPFIKPVGLDAYPWSNKLFAIWKVLVLLYLMVALIPKCFRSKPKKKSVGFIGLCIFWLIYIAGCIRAGSDIVSVTTAAIASVMFLLLISYELRQRNGVILLRAMAWLFTGCILAHILSVFLTLAGLLKLGSTTNTTFLFGMDNYSAFFLYPMLAVVLFYHSLQYGKLKWHSWLLIIGVVFIYLLTASMTAAGAGLLMILLYLIHPMMKKLPKIRGVRWVFPIMAVLLVLICGFQIQKILASTLDSMSKGVTLNSRTIIWDMTLKLVAKRPVFGYGSFTAEQIANYVLYGTTHAHNLLLELLLRTGIVGTIAYLLFLCGFVPLGAVRHPNEIHKNILIVGLVAQLVLAFMDFYPTITAFYYFMGILYYWKDFSLQFHPRMSPIPVGTPLLQEKES